MKKKKLDGIVIPNQLDKNPPPRYRLSWMQSEKNIEQCEIQRKNQIKNALKNK